MFDKILIHANDFFEVARRCGFPKGEVTNDNFPLIVPEFVNLAFACELYIKAIAEFKNINVKKSHKLDELFERLNIQDKEEVYSIWRVSDCNNIDDHEYFRQMFKNNLEAITDVFTRFRYAHEWATTTISLEHSFTAEQFVKFSPLSAERPLGSPPVYSGFLKQIVLSLKTYAEQLMGNQYNS